MYHVAIGRIETAAAVAQW